MQKKKKKDERAHQQVTYHQIEEINVVNGHGVHELKQRECAVGRCYGQHDLRADYSQGNTYTLIVVCSIRP